jgi:glucosyl-3-phosphoglycerate synthase
MSSVSSGSDLALLKRDRGQTVTVCLPALNEEATIGAICDEVTTLMRGGGLVDELLVIDSGSEDDTVRVARAAGAIVHRSAELLPSIPFGGKGEAMWKSLAATESSIVVWLDADVANFEGRWVVELLAPLLQGRALLIKGSYRRPLTMNGSIDEDGGGRVTELLARPLINALWPNLAHVRQPLAGECAGYTSLMRNVPFLSGYAVELGLLVEFAHQYGGDAITDVDLGMRIHRNRPLREVGKMSFEIIHGALSLLESHNRATDLILSNVLVQPGDTVDSVHHVDIRRLPPRTTLIEAPTDKGSMVLAVAG